MWEPQAETLPREQLAQRSIEGMRRTLGRALTKAAWRRRLGAVTPDDIRGHDDWARLPFLTKDELRDAYPFGLACVQPRRIVRVQMSSGTTGNPIINPYSRGDVEQWAAVMARCYLAAGVGRRDVVQITPSFGLFTGGFGFHYGAERIGAMVVPSGAGRTSLQLALMRDLGATALTAFDIIGMAETGGPGLGIDCPAREGIQVWEDHYFCEIVDPATGEQRADGNDGEL